MNQFTIRAATQADAPNLARVIMMGVGDEICNDFAGQRHTTDDVHRLFTTLCQRDDTQYSYLNSLVAEDESGNFVGGIIGYDGAKLHQLREPFFILAAQMLDFKPDGEIQDETSDDEFYFDSLAVMPSWRGRGVASALLASMAERARNVGKPAGLLVDKTNPNARRLYEKTGFCRVGDRPFAGVMMDHMQMK